MDERDLSAAIEKLPKGYVSGLPFEEVKAGAKQAVDALLAEHTGEEALYSMRALAVRSLPLSVEGFGYFAWCISGRELPAHALRWAGKQIAQFQRGDEIKGLLNEGFRGSLKSAEGEMLCLYLHGHFPYMSGLVIQAGVKEAKRTCELFADTISKSAGWKACFPHVVPDVERGWSLDGYHIKDTREDYGKWIEKTTADHGRDPSFLAVSVVSGALGMHPTLYVFLDDIHDYDNTVSRTEMLGVVGRVRADILPTMSREGHKPLFMVSYTPWAEEDTYRMLEDIGWFEHIVTPVYTIDPNGDAELDGARVRLNWPQVFTVEVIKGWQKLGKREFGRMYLCDLTQGKGQTLKYYNFAHDLVNYAWPMVGGADPTNVDRPAHDLRKRSCFALAYVAKLPQGGAAVVDGVLEPCSQLEAENYILRAQNFSGWLRTMVENIGGGAGFIQTLMRNPKIRIVDSGLTGLGNTRTGGDKHTRIEREMAPWFENGTVRISDADTPFLNALRKLFDRFYELDRSDSAFDAADAVYHALRGMPEVLQMPRTGCGLPPVTAKKEKALFDFGRM